MHEGASWTIAEAARLSRVSARTLRHYDQIGLLRPAWTSPNGYRHYGEAELLRLQRILLLRELGMKLDTIADVLAGQTDKGEALAAHRVWLLAERDRMSTLAATVSSTLKALEEGRPMNAHDMFNGFDTNPYEEEAIARWGKERVAQSKASYAQLSTAQKLAMQDEFAAITADLARYQSAGRPADDADVQAAVARHHAWVCFSWTPDASAYVGLGQLYVDDERFAANYQKAGLDPLYLLAAIKVYAAENLP